MEDDEEAEDADEDMTEPPTGSRSWVRNSHRVNAVSHCWFPPLYEFVYRDARGRQVLRLGKKWSRLWSSIG